jgi:hypothetical protein
MQTRDSWIATDRRTYCHITTVGMSESTPSTPPNAAAEPSPVPVSSPFSSTNAAATRKGKSAVMKLDLVQDFCKDHLSPVPQDLEREGIDPLVQEFVSAMGDARYTSLCKLLNALSERTAGT